MTRRLPASSCTSISRQLACSWPSRQTRLDVRRAVEDLLAFLLRDAAEHAEDFALAGRRLKLCRRLKTFCSALSRMLQVL